VKATILGLSHRSARWVSSVPGMFMEAEYARPCATVLINAAPGERVDVLHGRTADVVEAWLREHPGVQVVCRDRSGVFDVPVDIEVTGCRLHPARGELAAKGAGDRSHGKVGGGWVGRHGQV
jgi:hypothetical protein